MDDSASISAGEKVIQHHYICSGGQCLMQFLQGFHLNFHQLIRGDLTGFGYGFADSATGGYMVFFDQKSVIETNAMILAAAHCCGIFLCQTQAGKGFAGVEYFNLAVGAV